MKDEIDKTKGTPFEKQSWSHEILWNVVVDTNSFNGLCQYCKQEKISV